MKKLLSVILALALLLPALSVADVLTQDWKAASDEELSAAMEEIAVEIEARKATPQAAKGSDSPQLNKKVTAVGIGSATQNLSYEIVATELRVWDDDSGLIPHFAYVTIKNTDTKPIYMKSCVMDFEDDQGNLLESTDFVGHCPDVIDPGETGYFYVSGVNGGYFLDPVDLSKGCSLTAQFSLEPAKKTVQPYEITDTKITYSDLFGDLCPCITGRIKNTSDKDDSMVYVYCILKDSKGKAIWIEGTNVRNLYAGVKIGFEAMMMSIDQNISKDDISTYEVIAEPNYFQ